MSFFCFRLSFRILHHIQPRFPRLCRQFLRFPLFLMTMAVWRSTSQVFCQVSLPCFSYNMFFKIRPRPGGSLRKATGIKLCFHHIISRGHAIHRLIIVMSAFMADSEEMFIRFLCCEAALVFLLSRLCSLEGSY